MALIKRGKLGAMLADMDMDASDLTRLLQALGDPAAPRAIARRVQRWNTGEARMPGEAIALLTLLGRVRSIMVELAVITGQED